MLSSLDELQSRRGTFSGQSLRCTKFRLNLFFVIAAVAQVAVVIMQILILCNGGHGGPLPEYKTCLNYTLQKALVCSEMANWTNMTIPSFGKDKPVYVGFIIALTVYNLLLCLYVLYEKRFFDIVSFLIVNLVTMLYACFEAWQFRPFGPNCSDLPTACGLAIGSAVVLFILLTVYGVFGLCYANVICSKNYMSYVAVSSGVKLLILFTIVFSVTQMTLLVTPGNYEFRLSLFLVAAAIVAYFVHQLTIYFNSCTGYLAIGFAIMLLCYYYEVKILRFATKSCPICHMLTDSLNDEYRSLELLLETCTDSSNVTLDAENDRSIQFENLAIFASVNFITTFVVFVIYLGFWWCQIHKDPTYRFRHKSWVVKIMCCNPAEIYISCNLWKLLKGSSGENGNDYALEVRS